MNLERFNNQIELVLGYNENTKLQVLRNNPKFAEVQRNYVIEQMRGQNPSVTTWIDCIANIAEEQFGKKFSNLQEIEQAIQESKIQQEDENKTTLHAKFEDEISGHGKYKNLFLGQPVKDVSLKMDRQKISESHSMADSEKIAQMKKKMNGKSLEDDL